MWRSACVLVCCLLTTLSINVTWNATNLTLPTQLYGAAFGIVDNKTYGRFYIFGGGNWINGSDNTVNSIYKSNITNDSFTTFKLLNNGTNIITTPTRFYCQAQCSVIIDNSFIYIVNPTLKRSMIYIFNTLNESWMDNSIVMNKLPYKNISSGSCVVTDQTRLFVIGGRLNISTGDVYTNAVQIYNIAENIWLNNATNMPISITETSCIYSHKVNSVFTFGGAAGNSVGLINKIFKYDLKKNNWTELNTKLNTAKLSIYALVDYHQSHFVYLIGGRREHGHFSNQTEIYDINKNIIYNTRNIMGIGRSETMSFIHPRNKSLIYTLGGYISYWNATYSCEMGTIQWSYEHNKSKWMIIALAGAILFLILCICICLYCRYCKQKRQQNQYDDALINNNNYIDKSYRTWDWNDITNWIIHLKNGEYSMYEDALRVNLQNDKTTGKNLKKIDKGDLEKYGISGFDHRFELLDEIQALRDINIPPDDEGNPRLQVVVNQQNHTQYID
eukprot:280559_1